MSQLVADCPRCGAKKITFNVLDSFCIYTTGEWDNIKVYEVFCLCGNCHRTTVYLVQQDGGANNDLFEDHIREVSGSLNKYVKIRGYINTTNQLTISPPEHLPEKIDTAFREGAVCLSVGCYNAAGTMFRLCLDFATIDLLPDSDDDGLNRKIRRSLGLRLGWLFDTGRLPEILKELSQCIKDDGNDGAHAGILGKIDAEDILDFTVMLLERLYTEPKRLELAKERREKRRLQS